MTEAVQPNKVPVVVGSTMVDGVLTCSELLNSVGF